MNRSAVLTAALVASLVSCGDSPLPTERDQDGPPLLPIPVLLVGCDADPVARTNALIAAISEANGIPEAVVSLAGRCRYTLTSPDNEASATGANGLPIITSTVTIVGDPNGTTIIERASDAPEFRILYVANGSSSALPRNSRGNLALNNLTLSGGSTRGQGGALFVHGGTVLIENSRIVGNRAGDDGGGVHNHTGNVTIQNSTIASNNAADHGGGVVSYFGSLRISSTRIENNTARDAGGLYNEGAGGGGATAHVVENSVISGNIAEVDGGGVRNTGGIVHINGSTVTSNSAGGSGAGIANGERGVVNVEAATIWGNTAQSRGGGMYSHNGRLRLLNSTISDNTAREGGGGVSSDRSAVLTAIFATITNNTVQSGNGGGVLMQNDSDAEARIKASIIVGNAPDDVAANEARARVCCSLGYNLIGSAGPQIVSSRDFGAAGDRSGVTTAQANLGPLQDNGGATLTRALRSGSHAINAVSNCGDESGALVTHDQRGVTRPQPDGGNCDSGAVETTSPGTPAIIFDQPTSPQTFGATFNVNPTSTSGQAVSVSASGGCRVTAVSTGFDVTMTSGSTSCTLTATSPGAANVVRTVEARRASQTIQFTSTPPSPALVGGTYAVSATASSGLAVTFSSLTTGVCTLSGSTVSLNSTGTCSIAADQGGNDDYLAAPRATQSFTVSSSATPPPPPPDEGGIAYRSHSNAHNRKARTLTISRPAGAQSGDVLIAQITFEKGSDAGNSGQITPSGWTLVVHTNRGTDIGQAVFYRVVQSGEPGSYTWTFSQSVKAAGGIIRYSGVNTGNPIVGSSGNTGDSRTLTATSINVPSGSMLTAFFGMKEDEVRFSNIPGMTTRYTFENPEDITIGAADELRSSGGPTGNRSTTADDDDKWVAQLVGLRAQ